MPISISSHCFIGAALARYLAEVSMFSSTDSSELLCQQTAGLGGRDARGGREARSSKAHIPDYHNTR